MRLSTGEPVREDLQGLLVPRGLLKSEFFLAKFECLISLPQKSHSINRKNRETKLHGLFYTRSVVIDKPASTMNDFEKLCLSLSSILIR